mgnify:CR=1 FL=1
MSKVLIIGGGAAGMMAAVAAGETVMKCGCMRKMTVWEENYSSPGRDAAILRMQGTWKPCLLP